jgi:PAS domain S-box-containing protein
MARRPRSFWERLVVDYERGEQTQQAFCNERGVSLSTFQYWLYRTRRQRQEGAALPIDDLDELWPTVYERAPCAMSLLDREHRIVAANAQFRELFGEWEGLYCFEVFKREHRPCANCGTARAFSDGAAHFGQEQGVDKDGNRVIYEVTAAPIRGNAGTIDYVLEMCVDISRLKQLERQYETLFQRVPCYLTVVDRELRVVETNLRHRERFGEVRGQSWPEVLARAGYPRNCAAEQVFVDARVQVRSMSAGQGRPALRVHAAPLTWKGGEITAIAISTGSPWAIACKESNDVESADAYRAAQHHRPGRGAHRRGRGAFRLFLEAGRRRLRAPQTTRRAQAPPDGLRDVPFLSLFGKRGRGMRDVPFLSLFGKRGRGI